MKILGLMIKKAESEKALEKRLTEEVKKRGGMALKFTSQFHRGIPDRIVLLPFHTITFVEMKSTGEKPTKLQEAAMAKLESLGFRSIVIDSTEKLDDYLSRMDYRLQKVNARIEAEMGPTSEQINALKDKYGKK